MFGEIAPKIKSTTDGLNITSSSSAALTVGQNGITNPTIQIDTSTPSSATGFSIKSAAAGGGVTLNVISSAADEGSTINFTKGNGTAIINGGGTTFGVNAGGTLQLKSGGSVIAQVFGSGCTFGSNFRGFQHGTNFTFSGSTDSSLDANSEALDMDLNFAQSKTHNTGAVTTQRSTVLRPSTHAYAAASAVTNMYGLSITGGPVAGANNTTTTLAALNVETASCVNTGTVTNSYSFIFNKLSGATNNYVGKLDAGVIQQGTTTVASLIAAGTAGAGARSIVSDATAPTFGATVTGGGAVVIPVYSDGSNWKVG